MLASGLREEVAPGELLAKFVLSDRHFSRAPQRVKAAAFIPPPGKGSSVFRVSELLAEDVRGIGETVAAARQPPRTLYGHAQIEAASVFATGLSVVAGEPPPRHGDILGWPEEKDLQLELAHSLADATELVLYR